MPKLSVLSISSAEQTGYAPLSVGTESVKARFCQVMWQMAGRLLKGMCQKIPCCHDADHDPLRHRPGHDRHDREAIPTGVLQQIYTLTGN